MYQPEKSTIVEHSIELEHRLKFQDTKILAKTSVYMDQLVYESTEIWLHLNNVNYKEGFKLSQAWNPAIRFLKLNDTDMKTKTIQQTEDHSPV